MIHLWLVYFQEILEGVPRQILAYTISFKLPQHEMYTMDDLFLGEMLVLVYNHDLLKICLTILPFSDVGLFLEVGRCTQIPTENNEQTPDHNDDTIQLELKYYLAICCFVGVCASTKLIVIIIFPNCFHDCIKTGLCIFIVFICRM
jgi:hypothetical protein